MTSASNLTPAAVLLGAGVPHALIGPDRGAARAYLDALEAAGYGYLSVSDHVVGADRASHPEWSGPYDLGRRSAEPAVLLGYLSALTGLELASGVVVLPTRPAALVAKQAAEIDRLTDGRFTLGVGLGWSPVDFEATGADMTTRGARFEEQIEVMRRLWTEPVVTFAGRFHTITGAGINPRPVQQPIPVSIATTDSPRARSGALVGSATAGSRPSPSAPSSTRRGRSSIRPRATRAVTRRASGWRARSRSAPRRSTRWSPSSMLGAPRARDACS